jgi:hypothetical protein
MRVFVSENTDSKLNPLERHLKQQNALLIGTSACQKHFFTSNQTEVVSLPVNKYCPTNIVAPGLTACKEQSFLFNSLWKQQNKLRTSWYIACKAKNKK